MIIIVQSGESIEAYGVEEEPILLNDTYPLYGVWIDGEEEVYEKLHYAVSAVYYALLQGAGIIYLVGYDFQMNPHTLLEVQDGQPIRQGNRYRHHHRNTSPGSKTHA